MATCERKACPRCGEDEKAHRPEPGCLYNGWRNYETWAVKLWIDNEQSSQEFWREQALEAWSMAESNANVPSIWTREQAARFTLADGLKSQYEEDMPGGDAGIWADLLGAALSEVAWDDIAEALLEDAGVPA